MFAAFYSDNITNEDCWWWRSRDGSYHVLSHRMTPDNRGSAASGGHAFSRNVSTGWVEAVTPAYYTELDIAGGRALRIGRRARPQLLMDPKTGAPAVLYNGVTRSHASMGYVDPFTFAQKIDS